MRPQEVSKNYQKSTPDMVDAGRRREKEKSSMTAITIARLCRLYQKIKQGDQVALYSLENMGLKGNRVEVLRNIEEMVKNQLAKETA